MPINTAQRLALFAPSPDLIAPPAPAFTPQTMAIDFDGVTEQLEGPAAILGFGDSFTIAGWYKITNTLSRQDTLWEVGVGTADVIRIFQRSNVGTPPSIQVVAAATNDAWPSLPLTAGVWAHIVFVWDTSAFMHLWIDGVDQGAQSAAGSLADVSRTISVAKASTGVPNFLGRCASLAIWPQRLGDLEIPAVYNAGSIDFDLETDQGNYTSGASMLHWFEIGKRAAPNIGISTVGSYDLGVSAVGITDADRVADVPT